MSTVYNPLVRPLLTEPGRPPNIGGFETGGSFPPLPPAPPITPPIIGPSPGTIGIVPVEPGAPTPAEDELINIVNNFAVQNNIDTSPIGNAISQGIRGVVQSIDAVQQQTAASVTRAINGYSTSLFGWAQDLFGWLKNNIGSILSGLVHGVEKVAKTIYDSVGAALTTITGIVKDTVVPVLRTIEKHIQEIAVFYTEKIEPILRTIAELQRTVTAAVDAIEKDVKAGLIGLLQLPVDLSNAIQSIDSALIRAGKALKVKRKADADVYLYGDEPDSFAYHIKQLGTAVSGLSGKKEKTTYQPGQEKFTEPTLAQVIPELLEAFNAIVGDLLGAVKALWHQPALGAESIGIVATLLGLELVEPIELLYMLFEVLKIPMEALGEVASERVREKTLLSKLDPALLAQAVRRGFISKETMDEEGAVQGYNKDRLEILRRLTTYVESSETLLDYSFRGIITDTDLSNGLSVLGFTDDQKAALRDASTRILDVSTAIQAFRRQEITEEQLDQTLTVNRFNDADRELVKALALSPGDPNLYLRAHLIHTLLDDWGITRPTIDEVQKDVRDAFRANGLNDAAIVAWFTSGINTLPAEFWLQLYWRGMATKAQLQIALERDRVPKTFWENWIDSQRPLIPFRTIPGMIAAGTISQADGLRMLQEHGYSLANANLLIHYATRGSKTAKADTAKAQHDASLATAKTAYEDGLISEDEYLSLLQAHGLDRNAAMLDVKLAQISAETKARKQVGTDIVNEYQAGLIDQQGAFQALASSGLTIAEQAAVQKRMRGAATAKAKLPSEAELRAMAKQDIITVDEYESTLQTQGFASKWAKAFRLLHFPAETRSI